MNKENVKLWVAALRSGKYKQGENYLHITNEEGEDQYCCLGVACAVAVENGVDLEMSVNLNTHEYDHCGATLPLTVMHWLGTVNPNPKTEDDSINGFGKASLTHLNDAKRYDFNKIADVIERDFIK